MNKYDTGITYCTTSPTASIVPEEYIRIPKSKYLRKFIDKFAEYREQLDDDKEKKEFDDFLDIVKKST